MNPKWNGQFSHFDLVASTSDGVPSVVRAGDVEIGGGDFVVMAGPCAVESERQLLRTAEAVAEAGARVLRGGAYKPRSSPYAFQGLGLDGLKILRKAREETGLAIVTEAMSEEDVELVAEYADLMQVGTRSMQNYALLERLGGCGRPVLLKRGMTATLEELLQSAQVIAMNGNSQIVLCERGIRTFETATRNTLDIAAVPVLKTVSRLPVIVDPSHAAGVRCLVPVLARAAAVVGAAAVLVEVHPSPDQAMSDGEQSLTFGTFRDMMDDLQPYLAIRDAARQTSAQLEAMGAADSCGCGPSRCAYPRLSSWPESLWRELWDSGPRFPCSPRARIPPHSFSPLPSGMSRWHGNAAPTDSVPAQTYFCKTQTAAVRCSHVSPFPPTPRFHSMARVCCSPARRKPKIAGRSGKLPWTQPRRAPRRGELLSAPTTAFVPSTCRKTASCMQGKAPAAS